LNEAGSSTAGRESANVVGARGIYPWGGKKGKQQPKAGVEQPKENHTWGNQVTTSKQPKSKGIVVHGRSRQVGNQKRAKETSKSLGIKTGWGSGSKRWRIRP